MIHALFDSLALREPRWLLLALLAVPVYLIARRSAGRVRFSSLALFPARAQTLRMRLAFVPDLFIALAVIALAVALAGPRTGAERARRERRGISIMMVVDISGSMQALDLSEPDEERTRLDATKRVFSDFVGGKGGLRGRPDDAIGVVSFARYADTRSPLTLDHDSLARVVESLTLVTDRSEDGTAIGEGLGLAVERLREATTASKVAILLTDGVNNAGETDPTAAAKLAKSLGVKVYAIGAGTNGVAPVRVTDPLSGRSALRGVPVEIDEALLRELAAETGGRYFRATDADALRAVYQEIDRLERSRIMKVEFSTWHEHYATCVALALGLLASGWLLAGTLLRRGP
ncbi:MAG: VWA domain-containing protein [Myxococcales bacterium]|nr:VWA domain-containing protein [Myxococcales bacterium]